MDQINIVTFIALFGFLTLGGFGACQAMEFHERLLNLRPVCEKDSLSRWPDDDLKPYWICKLDGTWMKGS